MKLSLIYQPRRLNKIFLTAAFVIAAVLFIINQASPGRDIYNGIQFSAAVVDCEGKPLRYYLTDDQTYRFFIPLEQYSESFVDTVLAQEDRCFRYHGGVNPVSLIKGFSSTYISGSSRRGGSTISMQAARLRYNIDSSTPGGKLKQVFSAFWLELLYTKDEILEYYLNTAPCGGNIEGFGTASYLYYNTHIANTLAAQQLMLAVIPQDPTGRNPAQLRTAGSVSEEVSAAVTRLAGRLGYEDGVSLSGMLPEVSTERPFCAPHFSDKIYSNYKHGNNIQDSQKLQTSLDSGFQQLVDVEVEKYLTEFDRYGINNCAVVILDIETGNILAYSGSGGYFNKEISGMINGVETPRSPGSLLKPFIYQLGINQGVIHSKSILKDIPVSFGGWTPENFEKNYSGLISVRDALIESKNIPAIIVERNLEKHDLYHFLQKRGVGLKDRSFYGDTLVLGSAEMSLLQLCRLYADIPAEFSGLSAESAYIIMQILKDNPPPRKFRKNILCRNVAWKTGTSRGFKDCWSIGLFDRYAAGVWGGNFDNTGNPNFVGREAAGPLLFRLISSLRSSGLSESSDKIFSQKYYSDKSGKTQLNIVEAEICSVSGMLCGENCIHREKTLFIPGVSPIETCNVHQLSTDKITGEHFIEEYWPADISDFFRKKGLPVNSGNSNIVEKNLDHKRELSIISPQSNLNYYILAGEDSLQLKLESSTGNGLTHWYLNGAFLRSTVPDEISFLQLGPGKYYLEATTDNNYDGASFTVSMP